MSKCYGRRGDLRCERPRHDKYSPHRADEGEMHPVDDEETGEQRIVYTPHIVEWWDEKR